MFLDLLIYAISENVNEELLILIAKDAGWGPEKGSIEDWAYPFCLA